MTTHKPYSQSRALEVLARLVDDVCGPVLVHSDVFRTSGAFPGVAGREALLSAHTGLLVESAGERPIWMPAFNYDFVQTKAFSVPQDVSQVGVLTEHFRQKIAAWRTPIPVFSVCGTGVPPEVNIGPLIDPFGADSVFAQLVEQNGSILLYGACIDSCAFIHHAERAAGGPAYRYDKSFVGNVTDQVSRETKLLYHVRPRGHHLNYDWSRLERELGENGLLRRFESSRFAVTSIQAGALRSFWSNRLAVDPLHLLDRESRAWVEPKLQKLGRAFRLTDFESIGGENDE